MEFELDFTMSSLCDTNVSDSFPTNIKCALLPGIKTFRGLLPSPLCTILHSFLPMIAIPSLSNSCCTPSTYGFLTATLGLFPIGEPFSTVAFMLAESGLLITYPYNPLDSPSFYKRCYLRHCRRRWTSLIFLFRQHPSTLSYKLPTRNSLYSVFEQYRFSPVCHVKFHISHPYAQTVPNYYRLETIVDCSRKEFRFEVSHIYSP